MSVSELRHALLKHLGIDSSCSRILIFIFKEDFIPRNSIVDQLPGVFEILVQLSRIEVVHDLTVLFTQFLEYLLVVNSQERHKCLVFQQNRFLVDLKICVWLSQIVHLRQQESVRSAAHLVLQFLDLWLDLLQALGILANSIRWILHVKDHFVQLFNLVKIAYGVSFYILIAEDLNEIICEQCAVQVIGQELVQIPSIPQLYVIGLAPFLQSPDLV